jgi:sugar phosphate isomerase/epimerase
VAIADLSRLAIHTITTRPWGLDTAIARYAAAGVKGITVWRDALDGLDIRAAGGRIRDAGLTVVSLCRGGFFASPDASARRRAVDDNLRAIDEAEKLGAPLIVLVCGADPRQSLETSRDQICEALSEIGPAARAAKVRLGVEPLHPMYADSRSAINNLATAVDVCERVGDLNVGVAIDVYHLWWDPDLEAQIGRTARAGRLFAFHICDWRTPTVDMLNDRGVMGEGCIPIARIRSWVEQTGFRGFNEVEVFSTRLWCTNQDRLLESVVEAYRRHA